MTEMIHIYAAKNQSKELLRELSNGVDIDSCNKQGCTPLFRAVRVGQPTMVSLLLSKGASIYIANNYKQNLLHAAAIGLNFVNPADEAKVEDYFKIIHLLLSYEKQLRSKDRDYYLNAPLLKDAKAETNCTPLALFRGLCLSSETLQHVAAFKAVIEQYYPEPSVREDLAQLVSLLWRGGTSLFSRSQSSASQQEQEETESLLESGSSPKPKFD